MVLTSLEQTQLIDGTIGSDLFLFTKKNYRPQKNVTFIRKPRIEVVNSSELLAHESESISPNVYDDVIQNMVAIQEISSNLSFRLVIIATIEFGIPECDV